MLLPIRDQSVRRRSRLYGSNKPARSSKLSLLSAVTASSSGSNGSSVTVTQDSYSQSREDTNRPRRKRRSRESKSGKSRDEGGSHDGVTDDKKRSVDVFDFLVKNPDRARREPVPAEEILEDVQDDLCLESDPECYYRGHVSDSGISMGSMGDSTTIDTPHTPLLPPVLEEPTARRYSSASSVAECPYCQYQSHVSWNNFAGTICDCMQASPDQIQERRQEHQNDSNPKDSRGSLVGFTPVLPSFTPTPLVFKVDDASETPLPLTFRGFHDLNVRLLLQMQAHIAELEAQLKALDAKKASTTATTNKEASKIKARRHSQQPGKDQMKRNAIYQELNVRLNQYYQALSTAHEFNQISEIPSEAQIAKFRAWINSNVSLFSLPFNCQPLLQDDRDFIYLKSSQKQLWSKSNLQIISFSILLNTMIPLFLFKFVVGVLDRLIIWSALIAFSAFMMAKSTARLGILHQNCTIAFGCISLAAAVLV